MGSNPINLFFRFLLELTAWVGMGVWGWQQGQGWPRYVLVVALPLISTVIWGTFAVPDDPSRSGKAPVPVPGSLRLVVELLTFGVGVWAYADVGRTQFAWVFGVLVAVHYLLSYDRIGWLLKQ